MTYIVPCNPNCYDVYGAFESMGTVDWKQRLTSVTEGDIVYIYVSKPVMEICFRCVVRAVNKPLSTIDDSAFVKDGSPFLNYSRYMELEMKEQYDGKLPFALLQIIGIKGNIMGARSIPKEIADQIECIAHHQESYT